jgi:hypothetical protein
VCCRSFEPAFNTPTGFFRGLRQNSPFHCGFGDVNHGLRKNWERLFGMRELIGATDIQIIDYTVDEVSVAG